MAPQSPISPHQTAAAMHCIVVSYRFILSNPNVFKGIGRVTKNNATRILNGFL
jgi:hypothetical protein